LRKASTLIVPCLAVGLLIAGCGGGDDHLTKAEYLKQGNAICKRGNDEIDAAAKQQFSDQLSKGQRPSDATLVNFTTDSVIPNVEDQIAQLRDLSPPKGDEDTVNAIYDAADEGLDKLKADPSLAGQGPSGGGAFTEADKLARDYGLVACSD
jgi:hypothetical protein